MSFVVRVTDDIVEQMRARVLADCKEHLRKSKL